MHLHPQAKWYVTIPAESHPLVGRGAGPFDTERQARDWLLCLPVIKGAHVWRTTAADRRATARHQPSTGIVYRSAGDGGSRLVWNLSQGGAGLIVNDPLPPGATLTGELVSPATGSTTVAGRVRHLEPRAPAAIWLVANSTYRCPRKTWPRSSPRRMGRGGTPDASQARATPNTTQHLPSGISPLNPPFDPPLARARL